MTRKEKETSIIDDMSRMKELLDAFKKPTDAQVDDFLNRDREKENEHFDYWNDDTKGYGQK